MPDTEKDVVISHIIQSHVATKETYVKSHTKNINCSPRLFTDFIQLFLSLLESNLEEIRLKVYLSNTRKIVDKTNMHANILQAATTQRKNNNILQCKFVLFCDCFFL